MSNSSSKFTVYSSKYTISTIYTKMLYKSRTHCDYVSSKWTLIIISPSSGLFYDKRLCCLSKEVMTPGIALWLMIHSKELSDAFHTLSCSGMPDRYEAFDLCTGKICHVDFHKFDTVLFVHSELPIRSLRTLKPWDKGIELCRAEGSTISHWRAFTLQTWHSLNKDPSRALFGSKLRGSQWATFNSW